MRTPPSRASKGLLALLLAPLLVACSRQPSNSPLPLSNPRIHPVFDTPITGESAKRPALQIEVLNDKEFFIFTADLYLAVQSSRFPNDAWVLLPVNVGDFQGCKSRFVQLPFEVSAEDTLLFNLLDDDYWSVEDERQVVNCCRLTGYCVLLAGAIYAPKAAQIVAPSTDDAGTLLGETVVEVLPNGFEHRAHAEFVSPEVLPARPNEANRLTLLDDHDYANAHVRIFGPPNSLSLETPLAEMTASQHADASNP